MLFNIDKFKYFVMNQPSLHRRSAFAVVKNIFTILEQARKPKDVVEHIRELKVILRMPG